jgi:hypothetical protein
MKKILVTLTVSLAAIGWLGVMGGVGGCGLLDSASGITISLPTQEFDFDLNADQARSQLEQALNDQLPQGFDLDLSGQSEIPTEVCVGQQCQPVPAVQETFTFDLPAQQIDFSDNQDLKRYVEAGKVKDVKIKFISYNIASNSLNFNLPEVELYMDALGAAQITASSDKIAVLPAVNAGVTGEGNVQFTTDGRQIMSNYLLGYKFAMLGRTSYTIDTAVTRTIPQGQMVGKVQIGLEFTVDPI